MATDRSSIISNSSDVTFLSLPAAEIDELQAEFGPAKFEELRIFVFDKSYKNATVLDHSTGLQGDPSYHSKYFCDRMRKALLIACAVYRTKKGSKTLRTMAEIWIKKFMPKNKEPEKTAKTAARD
jgi:hypothetical protein